MVLVLRSLIETDLTEKEAVIYVNLLANFFLIFSLRDRATLHLR